MNLSCSTAKILPIFQAAVDGLIKVLMNYCLHVSHCVLKLLAQRHVGSVNLTDIGVVNSHENQTWFWQSSYVNTLRSPGQWSRAVILSGRYKPPIIIFSILLLPLIHCLDKVMGLSAWTNKFVTQSNTEVTSDE